MHLRLVATIYVLYLYQYRYTGKYCFSRSRMLTRHELAKSQLYNRKQLLVASRAHICAFRHSLTMLESGREELKHIQGAGKVPSPVGREVSKHILGN